MQRPAATATQDSSALNGRSFGAFVICGDAAASERGDVPLRGAVHADVLFVRSNTFQCFTFSLLEK